MNYYLMHKGWVIDQITLSTDQEAINFFTANFELKSGMRIEDEDDNVILEAA